MMRVKDQLDRAGVALVAVGSGTPAQARRFVENFNFKGEMYLDQELAAFKAFGLVRGFWKTLGPASLVRGAKTLSQGFHQGLPAGDLWQQGGVFVVGPGNQIHFEHRDRYAGDHADPREVLAACR